MHVGGGPRVSAFPWSFCYDMFDKSAALGLLVVRLGYLGDDILAHYPAVSVLF